MIKVSFNLPQEDINFLQATAKKENKTFTDILNRSIHTERFFVEQEDLGHKILIEDQKSQLYEVYHA
jgi:hypothetical protein